MQESLGLALAGEVQCSASFCPLSHWAARSGACVGADHGFADISEQQALHDLLSHFVCLPSINAEKQEKKIGERDIKRNTFLLQFWLTLGESTGFMATRHMEELRIKRAAPYPSRTNYCTSPSPCRDNILTF